jgi:hypothetical protein
MTVSGWTHPVSTNTVTAAIRLRQACWRLVLIAAAIWPLFAAVGYARSGWVGILAALLAAGVCGGAALLGLAIASWSRVGAGAVPVILFSMGLRTGIPLVVCAVLMSNGGPLVKAGAPMMILVYYLLMLLVETWLLLGLTSAAPGPKTASPKDANENSESEVS